MEKADCPFSDRLLEGNPLRCSDCGQGPQARDVSLADLQELLGAADEPPRGLDRRPKVGEGDQVHHRLQQLFDKREILQVFECPACGRQSVFRTDESPYCAWCEPPQGSRPRRERQPAIDPGGQIPRPPALGWADVFSALAPSNLGYLFGNLVRLMLSDIRLTLSVLFLALWGSLLFFALSRDLSESVGHKLRLAFSATSTIQGRVVERYEQRPPQGPSNYYITSRYSVPGADGQLQELTKRERVKWSLYDRLKAGATVTVRYARRDPSIATISGNEGLCIGTTCLTSVVFLAVVFTLYMWSASLAE